MSEKLKLKTDMTRDDFLKLFKKCKDLRLRERYQAMYLSFKYDWKEISEILGRDYETVLSWVYAFNVHGLEGLKMDNPPGRPSSLNSEQLGELKKTVQCSPRTIGLKFSNWNCKTIDELIKCKFKVRLSVERIRQILHELGFVRIKPSYRFVLADKLSRKRFLQRIKSVFSRFKSGDVLLFQDEASIKQHPTLSARWMLKGTKQFVNTLGNHAKVSVFGAINHALGKVYHMKSKTMNGKTFMKFVNRLLRSHKGKRLFLVIDNAPWHRSLEVGKFMKKNKRRLEILWLPTYSPDFNPIEHLWKCMRDNVSHNTFFSTIGELKNVLSEFFKKIYSTPQKIKSLCSPDYLFG